MIILEYLAFSLTIFLAYVDGEKRAKRPSYFPTCYRNDPLLNQCLVNATDVVRKYLAEGIPELKIPPFEPFILPELYLEQGTPALNFKAVLSNIFIHGLTKYEFSRFDFDVPNCQFFCEAHIPGLSMEGDYSVSGQILVTPIEGHGRFVADIDSADVFVYQKYEQVTLDDDQVHLFPVVTNSSIKVVEPRAHLDGLFNGNEDLNAATNKAINDNVNILFEELKPALEHTINRILEDMVFKSIIYNIPWDELYPINPDL